MAANPFSAQLDTLNTSPVAAQGQPASPQLGRRGARFAHRAAKAAAQQTSANMLAPTEKQQQGQKTSMIQPKTLSVQHLMNGRSHQHMLE